MIFLRCTICEENLVKVGRPEVLPCPSCAHLNEAKCTTCSLCVCIN